MINIVFTMASEDLFEQGGKKIPLQLFEINGRPLISYIIESFSNVKGIKRFIFIINASHADRFALEKTLKLLCPKKSLVLTVGKTKGALCTVMLAADFIDANELLVVNSDQLILNIDVLLEKFKKSKCEAGVLSFKSTLKRWAYGLIRNEKLLESFVRNPTSSNALAGFFYFKNGIDFLINAKKTIKNSWTTDGLFYVPSVLNQFILDANTINAIKIDEEHILNLYSKDMINKNRKNLSK